MSHSDAKWVFTGKNPLTFTDQICYQKYVKFLWLLMSFTSFTISISVSKITLTTHSQTRGRLVHCTPLTRKTITILTEIHNGCESVILSWINQKIQCFVIQQQFIRFYENHAKLLELFHTWTNTQTDTGKNITCITKEINVRILINNDNKWTSHSLVQL